MGVDDVDFVPVATVNLGHTETYDALECYGAATLKSREDERRQKYSGVPRTPPFAIHGYHRLGESRATAANG